MSFQEPPAQDSIDLHEGDLVAGKYRVERILGQGAMGVVVAALHEQLDERVAIKILLTDAGNKEEVASRFLREARAAVKIRSAHVARVFDVGTLQDNRPYIVMEHLQGKDLSAVLLERGPLPQDEAISYVLQACEALAEAHAIGIVHRDLKPSNLFLSEEPNGQSLIKVLDFGISKITGLALAGSSDVALTAPAAIMGSPLYMSPEQIRSAKDVDVRTDIWALGVILYELLTNRTPFDADSTLALLAAICADVPAPLRRHRPDARAEIETVIAGCLEKDVSRRIPTIVDLARALSPFGPDGAMAAVERAARTTARLAMQSSPGFTNPRPASVPPGPLQGVAAPPSPLQTAPPAAHPMPSPAVEAVPRQTAAVVTHANVNTNAETVGSWTQAGPPRARRPMLAVAAVAGILVAGGIAVFLALQSSKPEESVIESTSTSPSGPAAATEGRSEPAPAAAPPAPPMVSATPAAPEADRAKPSDLPSKPESVKPAAGRLPSPVASATAKTPAQPNPPTGVQLGKEVDSRR